ncbi:MAG: DUF349 domain-containing protein [Flavobacteriaceae bacterium]|nr:MAG: DUF349 domain-containing protein [Flavobacteriaceae bacterium]
MLDVNNDQLSSDSKAEGEERLQEDNTVKAKKEKTESVEKQMKDTQVAPEKSEVETGDAIESDKRETKKEPEGETKVKSEEKPEEKTEAITEEKTEAVTEEKPEEKKQEVTKKKIPEFDIATLTLEGVVATMKNLLEEFDIQEIKQKIEDLRIDFLKKFKALIQEKKEEHVKAGGKVEDFFFNAAVKNKFDEQLSIYKRKRQQFYRDIERIQKENLELRLQLIDELKQLIDNAEASTMYKNFKNLQERWRAVGQIPHAKYNDIWRTYHHHVERFYDLLHLNNDFRDLDFKHNLEEKTKLIEKAEALTKEEDVNHAFKELQILHRMWKEEIGPVARELREEVWHKFSEATKKIHKKRHEFQEVLDERYKANVGLKLAVIEKINQLDFQKNESHKDWQKSIKELDKLRDEFFSIGKVPKAKNEEVWQLFREATRKFNAEKNAFYKGIKKSQSENLKKKLALVEKAEEFKESDNWSEATEIYKKIQAEWKKIGHVPRKDSDKIWKRFKDACNHYFDRLHEKQNDLDKDQSALIDKKKEFIENLKQEIEKGKDISSDIVHKALEQWRSLGVLPQKVKHLDIKFNKVLDAAYKKLNIDKDEADFLRFKSTVDSMLDQKNTRKLDSEQLFVRRKIDDITKEIKQLENNISFISNASEDNPLVKNVYKNINGHKKSLEVWKRKLSYMKKMEY